MFQRLFIRCVFCLVSGIMFGAANTQASAQEPALGMDITISSDHLFRGVSQTLGKSTLQASLDVEFDSGFYTYVWAANVDFIPSGEPDDGANLEIDVALGYATELSEKWSVDSMFVRYVFPGTIGSGAYDYDELLATVWFDDRYFATVGYSDEVFGEDAPGMFYSLGVYQDLPAELSLAVEIGYYDLGAAYGASYSYVDVGLSRPIGNATLTFSYYNTHGDPLDVFYAESIGPRFVLSLEIGLFR